jgi:hypothetical protein
LVTSSKFWRLRAAAGKKHVRRSETGSACTRASVRSRVGSVRSCQRGDRSDRIGRCPRKERERARELEKVSACTAETKTDRRATRAGCTQVRQPRCGGLGSDAPGAAGPKGFPPHGEVPSRGGYPSDAGRNRNPSEPKPHERRWRRRHPNASKTRAVRSPQPPAGLGPEPPLRMLRRIPASRRFFGTSRGGYPAAATATEIRPQPCERASERAPTFPSGELAAAAAPLEAASKGGLRTLRGTGSALRAFGPSSGPSCEEKRKEREKERDQNAATHNTL